MRKRNLCGWEGGESVESSGITDHTIDGADHISTARKLLTALRFVRLYKVVTDPIRIGGPGHTVGINEPERKFVGGLYGTALIDPRLIARLAQIW